MYILLIDDHTLFREALLHVLNQLELQIIVLEAANTEDAAQLITRARNLDLILLDIDLPGVDGLTALPGLRELAPTVPVTWRYSPGLRALRAATTLTAMNPYAAKFSQ